MKGQAKLKEGLYFIHGYYMRDYDNANVKEISRNQMILMKDSMDNVYDIDAYDVNLWEANMENRIPQGEFVYYNGQNFMSAENNPTSIVYKELNKQLVSSIGYENYGNQPDEISDNILNVHSYHVNVGHGNCSIIVFSNNGKYNIWMVDCSVYDFTNKRNYCSNLDACIENIKDEFSVDKISKLLVTHLHYDHINGIEHMIRRGWIDKDTEVWMNIHYPWAQPTYNRILLELKGLGVKFIDPIVGNSSQHIKILYPNVSFNKKNRAPENNINNASVLYQVCLAGKSMLFTGDIETEGWENVKLCYTYLNNSTYYCVSHHGSITGHFRSNCVVPHRYINTLADCADSTKLQILMGRNGAYRGIFSKRVISEFHELLKTDDAKQYIKIRWASDEYEVC